MKLRQVVWVAIAILIGVTLLITTTSLNTATAQGPVKPPIPYPDAIKLDVGGAPVNRLPINKIVTYKALPQYHEAPWLDKLVAAGQLPPVEQRLPKEPQVYLTSGMKDGIGVYGDLWRGFSACPTAGYNNMAGVSMGWFGIEDYTVTYGALVKTGPLFRADQDIEPMPEIAKSWDWSADGMQLTLHLIEGAKWSDGVAFNADDVMFTWDGYIADPNVNSNKKLDAWPTANGKSTTLEKVDDYTVKFTFPVAKPLYVYYLMNESNFDVEPAHQLKPLHPKWSEANPKPTYKDFANALSPDKLPLVTMGPWAITEYKTDELMIMRRNPYYWKVDENGNQLPYMDEIQYRKGPSGIGRDLCTIAGDCDHMNLENPSTFVEAMTKAQDPSAKFNISWGPELLGYDVMFNYSLTTGVSGARDTAVRTLFRDLRFRQALSYATDRDGIAQSIMKGPFLRGWAGGLYPGAPDFDKSSVTYYPYDPPSAKALLAEIGLKPGADGVLTFASGPQAGQPIVIQMLASQDAKETQSVAEALVNQWGAVGIKVNMKIIDSQTHTDTMAAGNWDVSAERDVQAFALPFTNTSMLAPITKNFRWNLNAAGDPAQLMDFESQLVDIVNKYQATYDAAGRKDLMTQYNSIFTKNVYDLGVFVGRYGLGTAKRVKNIPDGTPVFMYQWVEPSILLDTLWTPTDQQLPQNRPNTIAIYGK